MIERNLAKLGFGDKETAVYLALLKHGKITPGALARIVNLNRTTVYSVAKELAKKGVVSEDLGGTNIRLVARPPRDLELIAKNEQKVLEEKKSIIKETISQLQEISASIKYQVPKIVFIEEGELDNYLYKQSPVWDKSLLQYDGTWWGFQDQTFVDYYERWIDWYWEEGSSPKTSLKLLSNESAEIIKKKKFERRQIRFWEHTKNLTATTWVNGDYVIMIVTSQHPHYLVEIFDGVLAHNLREMFKGIWSSMDVQRSS